MNSQGMASEKTEAHEIESNKIESQVSEVLGGFSQYYDALVRPEPLLLYGEELNQMIRLEKTAKQQPRLTILRGAKGSGRKLALRRLGFHFRQPILFIDHTAFLAKYAEYGKNLTYMLTWKISRLNCWLCICDRTDTEEERPLWERFLAEFQQAGFSCFITVQEKGAVIGKPECEMAEIEFRPPGLEGRALLWEHFLSKYRLGTDIDAVTLSGRYSMSGGAILQVLKAAALHQSSMGRDELCEADITAAAGSVFPGTMGNYARHVPCVFTWEDLVADENLAAALKNMCNQVKYRNIVGERWGFFEKRPYGNGICALFYGPPGTGKTMAAQVVASELGLELYRVDLSKMSSKYIGETQKNISTLFDYAREKNVILFFDEADALFTRRTQVKDANDRHANGEIAHLLQQLEEYEGVTILATNLRTQIDDAFKRRIKMMVGFRLPDCQTRKKLWRKALPEKAPVRPGLNLDFFAEKFEISGSEIKEIMLDAAFLAAAEEEEIGMQHICASLKTCYEKYGRVLGESDLKCYDK